MSPDYAEFGMASNFSFLRGASQPEELVVAAELHGYHAVGLADRNTVAGVVRAWSALKQLKEHGLDLDEWKDGAWKDWSRDDWLREAEDFINPVIEDLWDPDRMREADDPTEQRPRGCADQLAVMGDAELETPA